MLSVQVSRIISRHGTQDKVGLHQREISSFQWQGETSPAGSAGDVVFGNYDGSTRYSGRSELSAKWTGYLIELYFTFLTIKAQNKRQESNISLMLSCTYLFRKAETKQ